MPTMPTMPTTKAPASSYDRWRARRDVGVACKRYVHADVQVPELPKLAWLLCTVPEQVPVVAMCDFDRSHPEVVHDGTPRAFVTDGIENCTVSPTLAPADPDGLALWCPRPLPYENGRCVLIPPEPPSRAMPVPLLRRGNDAVYAGTYSRRDVLCEALSFEGVSSLAGAFLLGVHADETVGNVLVGLLAGGVLFAAMADPARFAATVGHEDVVVVAALTRAFQLGRIRRAQRQRG